MFQEVGFCLHLQFELNPLSPVKGRVSVSEHQQKKISKFYVNVNRPIALNYVGPT
jgi:hypothetical protein